MTEKLTPAYTLIGKHPLLSNSDKVQMLTWIERELRNMNQIETVVDKIRYAMDHDIQNNYVLDLLDMFDADSGKFKDD